MDRTLEVRWFFEGPAPFTVREWADALDLQHESTRTDLYLVSKDGGMNVKLREERIQTKRRLDGPTPVSLTEDARGYREHWVKWSFPLVEGAPDLHRDDPTGLWVPVHKERRQRTFTPDADGLLFGASVEQPMCAKVELTEAHVDTYEAYTLCVEAEGSEDELVDALQAAGAALLDAEETLGLVPNASFGYAKWLSTLVAQREIEPGNVSA